MSTKKTTKKKAKKKKINKKKKATLRGNKTPAEEEAKRQSVHVHADVIVAAEDDGGSHAIDHGTLFDNAVSPDTNKEASEDIAARAIADVSFWNNSWAWTKAARSYGSNPEDSWFVNPTPKLIAEVMNNAPTIHSACEVALIAGSHGEQLEKERARHVEFLRDAQEGDIVLEALDLLTAYQNRFFETVQRYLGLSASYENQCNSDNITDDQLASAKMRKEQAGAQCRAWAAKLIALKEAYHAIISDERAYNLTYAFDPLPPEEGKPATREYNLYRWSITNALNKIGRRLARSIKNGNLDAEKYRIPRPWLNESNTKNQLHADSIISDFI